MSLKRKKIGTLGLFLGWLVSFHSLINGVFSVVKEIEDLVILNDSLKSKEAKFKENCRKELAKLQKEIG